MLGLKFAGSNGVKSLTLDLHAPDIPSTWFIEHTVLIIGYSIMYFDLLMMIGIKVEQHKAGRPLF